jgi:hypothetical protein
MEGLRSYSCPRPSRVQGKGKQSADIVQQMTKKHYGVETKTRSGMHEILGVGFFPFFFRFHFGFARQPSLKTESKV